MLNGLDQHGQLIFEDTIGRATFELFDYGLLTFGSEQRNARDLRAILLSDLQGVAMAEGRSAMIEDDQVWRALPEMAPKVIRGLNPV